MTRETTALTTTRSVSVVLFLSLFAAQSGLIALSPVLMQVAGDLGTSTAAAGQLRSVAGLSAGVTALTLGRAGGRIGLGRQLLAGSLLVAIGSVGSAAAPSLALLALAQAPVGVGVGTLTTAGTLAAAQWVAPERRTAVLSWALVGQPAAWIVGMPLVGVLGEHNWRYGLLALPLAASLAAGLAVVRRAGEPPSRARTPSLRLALSHPGLARWLAAEALANTAWAGTLVFAGALFTDSYGSSTRLAGVVLAAGAGAYVAGNLGLRRIVAVQPGRLLTPLVVGLGLATVFFGAVRPSVLVSAIAFSVAAFFAGARTLGSSAFGLSAPPEARAAAMGARSASMQLGYFAGSIAAGTALAAGGYAAMGLVTGALFLAAAAVLRGLGTARASTETETPGPARGQVRAARRRPPRHRFA